MSKPEPRIDEKGVPWCDRKNCYSWKQSDKRGRFITSCTASGVCVPQVQLDEAELARLQAVVDGEPVRTARAIASFSGETQKRFTAPSDEPQILPDCLQRGREAMAVVEKLPKYLDTGGPILPGDKIYWPVYLDGYSSAHYASGFVKYVGVDQIQWCRPAGSSVCTKDATGKWYSTAKAAKAARELT